MPQNDNDGNKDVLPAYDGAGGPPKYFELDVRSASTGPEGGGRHREGDGSGVGTSSPLYPDAPLRL